MEIIGNWLNESIFEPWIEWCLSMFVDLFNASIGVLQTEVGKTPMEFSPAIVGTLRSISENVILPIAGIILTYVFCYELINMLLERNNMAEFDTKNLFVAIFKTFLAILLVTNCFNITMAFFDIGQHLVQSVSSSTITVNVGNLVETLIEDAGANVGIAFIYAIFSLVVMIAGFIATGLIYLVAWGRMVTVLLFISVAPIPFATLMNKDWISGIGQNYLKNLCALALQGFLMVVCVMIYGGLLAMVEPMILSSGGVMGLVMLLVIMFVCVKNLMGCLNFAKSIFGAS